MKTDFNVNVDTGPGNLAVPPHLTKQIGKRYKVRVHSGPTLPSSVQDLGSNINVTPDQFCDVEEAS